MQQRKGKSTKYTFMNFCFYAVDSHAAQISFSNQSYGCVDESSENKLSINLILSVYKLFCIWPSFGNTLYEKNPSNQVDNQLEPVLRLF